MTSQEKQENKPTLIYDDLVSRNPNLTNTQIYDLLLTALQMGFNIRNEVRRDFIEPGDPYEMVPYCGFCIIELKKDEERCPMCFGNYIEIKTI